MKLLLALFLGLVVCVAGNALVDLLVEGVILADGSWGFIDAPDVAAMHWLLSTIPLLPAAFSRHGGPQGWWLAGFLSLGNYLFDAWHISSTTGQGGGADIGFGLLMMVAPLVEALVVAIFVLRARSKVTEASSG